jgi:hypothetical protein
MMPYRAVKAVLLKASKLIRKGWCKGTLARGKSGRPCSPLSPRAASWCLDGALECAAGDRGDGFEWASWLVRMAVNTCVGGYGDWNDRQETRRPVIAALRRALRMVRQRRCS